MVLSSSREAGRGRFFYDLMSINPLARGDNKKPYRRVRLRCRFGRAGNWALSDKSLAELCRLELGLARSGRLAGACGLYRRDLGDQKLVEAHLVGVHDLEAIAFGVDAITLACGAAEAVD